MNAPFQFTYDDTSSHLVQPMDPKSRAKTVENSVKRIRESGFEFNSIVVTGLSGIIIGTLLSEVLGVPLFVVRKKEHPQPHSYRYIEGPDQINAARYLIVDDLVSSGSTVKRILKEMSKAGPASKCVGAYFYDESFDCTSTMRYLCDAWQYPPMIDCIGRTWNPPSRPIEEEEKENLVAELVTLRDLFDEERPPQIDLKNL